jgi:MFS family permease
VKSRLALLVALGVDNFGSGLFLPLAVVYATRVAGLPLGTAGALISLGTVTGLTTPPLAGRLVDRAGPKPVIISAQLLQALGAVVYFLARSGPEILVAAMLLAAGQQMFYSSLVALISDVTGTGASDHSFAVANMVRSAAFGLGGLAVAGVLTAAGSAGLRLAVAADAGSFVACSAVLALWVRLPRQHADHHAQTRPRGRGVLTDRPFLILIVATGLVAVAVDYFLSGTPVYVLEILHAPPWLPGTMLALVTALNTVGGTFVLRATRRLPRLTAVQLGAALYILWCAASLAAFVLPPGWRPAVLLSGVAFLAAAGLVFSPRVLALAEAAAPPAARGRFLAAFQYAFSVAVVLAPAIVALYSVAAWLPWTLVAAAAAVAIAAFRRLARWLPADALSLQPDTYRSRPGSDRLPAEAAEP